jgi:hypothetical protein
VHRDAERSRAFARRGDELLLADRSRNQVHVHVNKKHWSCRRERKSARRRHLRAGADPVLQPSASEVAALEDRRISARGFWELRAAA